MKALPKKPKYPVIIYSEYDMFNSSHWYVDIVFPSGDFYTSIHKYPNDPLCPAQADSFLESVYYLTEWANIVHWEYLK